MEDMVMYFLIWLFGTGCVVALIVASPLPYPAKIVFGILVVSGSVCFGSTVLAMLSWEENYMTFVICGGSLAFVCLVGGIRAWRFIRQAS